MELETTVVDKLKGLAKSTQDRAKEIVDWLQKSNRRSPIEILKRLQREAFSDIMKLRDRQEKVERMLVYKSSKGSPFNEASTRVKGKVDIVGALFFMDDVNKQKIEAILRSGIRTGIDATLAFETGIREQDTLVAEFIASENSQGDMLGGSLSLAKVIYKAHVNNWFSAVAIPMGARCRDVGIPASSQKETSPGNYSEFGPPLLNQENGSAIGIMVRKSNVVASLAHFVSGIELPVNSSRIGRSLSTFGQVMWQLPRNTKLFVLGMHTESRPSHQNISLGPLALPVSLFKRNRISNTSVYEDSVTSSETHNLSGSIALMLNSELDEGINIGGWIEMKNSSPRYVQWGLTVCDTLEDEFGGVLKFEGLLQGVNNLERFQVESYLNLNFGKRFKLQPGILYVKDGPTQFPALMLRSSWSL